MLGKVRLALWILVGLMAAGGIYLAVQPRPETFQTSSELPLETLGGPFTLTGSDGQPFTSSRLNGRPSAIFFGFTNCPDVCPTTIARLAKLRKQMGGDDAFNIVFISVDPERDGPKEVGRYAGLFGTSVIGLTGSPAQIEQVKDQFGVYSAKAPMPGGGYGVDHTAAVFVMDRAGKFVSTITPEESDTVALAKLKRVAA